MSHKSKSAISIITLLFIAVMTMAVAAGWQRPLAQTGMDMPTNTMQPGLIDSTATPIPQGTSVPVVNTPGAIAPSPTMTSIFTGFTPPPTAIVVGGSLMSGCGSSCGMGGSGSMGTTITGTLGMAGMTGMGSMGAAGMDMSGCMMMSGSGMSGSAMSGMGTGTDLLMSGMDMDDSSSLVGYESTLDTTNPWMILGWVVLGLVSLAIIFAVVFGVVLIVRHLRQARPA